MSPKLSRIFFLVSSVAVAAVPVILAQSHIPTPVRNPQRQALQAPAPVTPMRRPSDLIRKQEPLKVNQKLLRQTSADQLHIIVSLPKQRAYLMQADQVVIDSPISSGKRGHTSPSGQFTVLEKDPNHHSTLYGDFVDHSGRVVRAGVSARIDAAPSGTHFAGASMKWFMRLTGEGVGMHVGFLPGYPASHGCIRMPEEGAKLFYDHVKVGTPVSVGE
jgi:lipoprotein-anchoring transpeptidase ErfK/SrfK